MITSPMRIWQTAGRIWHGSMPKRHWLCWILMRPSVILDTEPYRGEIRRDAQKILKKLGERQR